MSLQEKVIYQIYPKSFQDTDQNGIGDLAGIIQRLPYLHKLGVDMLWLSPIYPSPQKDNGYDISDYCEIDPVFGTMQDFEKLIAAAKSRGIEIMVDMVLNHVSTAHPWFQKALAGDKKYQDYFILRDTPTDWVSKFGGSAWAPFGDTGKYYLHLYDPSQADLNWRNPRVREELFKVVDFWLKKGVKGLRFDVINVIGKDAILKDNPVDDGKPEYTDKPVTHEYLQELNRATFGKDPSIVTVGEMSSTTIENCILYTRPDRKELDMTFNFHHLKVDYEAGQKWTTCAFDFAELKRLLHSWGEAMSREDGWNALFWNNHDQPRALNRFIQWQDHRVKGAQMLAAAIHLNRGTPFIYMGEELGMLDPNYADITDYVDIEAQNAYRNLLAAGKPAAEALQIVKTKARDNARTPMQWSAEENAGFSKSTPWLKTAQNYSKINAARELEGGEIFPFYQQLIALRKRYPLISRGSYQAYLPDHPQVYSYLREYEGQKLLVLTNFYADHPTVTIPKEFLSGKELINNYPAKELTTSFEMLPYHALAILR